MRFAEDTSVSVERSSAEIESTLARYGARRFMRGWEEGRALVCFEMAERQVRFVLPLPDRAAEEFWVTHGGRRRREERAAYAAWEQACRQRWRALNLVIKAKLEAVETGITCFEDEFMAHLVLPGGKTMSEWARPQIAAAYESGKMPELLPWDGKGRR